MEVEPTEQRKHGVKREWEEKGVSVKTSNPNDSGQSTLKLVISVNKLRRRKQMPRHRT